MVEKAGDSWIKPVGGYVSSSFGTRINPIRQTEEFHNGIDIAVATGTPAAAIADGKVAYLGDSPTWGNYLKYEIADGYSVFYAHLDSISVSAGQKVQQGQKLAETGNTGLSTGAHLHLTIYKDDSEIDPLQFFDYRISGDAKNEYIARGENPPG